MKPSVVERDKDKNPVLVEFDFDGLRVGFREAGKVAYRIGSTDNYIPKPTFRDMIRTSYAIFKPRKRESKQLEFDLK